MTSVRDLRDAVVEALPIETSVHADTPEAASLYVPLAHIKALRFESSLIVGARGVGKSFWTAALKSPELRKLLGSTVPELDRTRVRIGFSVEESIDEYPNADSISNLLRRGVDPYDMWRSVILRWLATLIGRPLSNQKWVETVQRMKDNPEDSARLVSQANSFLESHDEFGLIVFDALDRTSTDWQEMDSVVRGLLRAALWLKSYSRLFAKVFLREDQYERTTDFPDASKLLSTKSELTWARHDLHGLLWQRLINANGRAGTRLRLLYKKATDRAPPKRLSTYLLTEDVKRETEKQRALFEALAGPWMGRDRRRGVPYTWSVGHLTDGRGQTSPRSFIAAIRQAAEDSRERYPDYRYPLHYESIKRGIQEASSIRVNEVAEDFPWVKTYLACLGGLNVPCEYSAVVEKWAAALPGGPSDTPPTHRLPAQHAERGWGGISEDLKRLGVFEIKKDGRIDMPDLYRVGFGLGRKGGVKPKN